MNEPTTGTKISTAPATSPGIDSGTIRRRSTLSREAPSERAASISESSIACRVR